MGGFPQEHIQEAIEAAKKGKLNKIITLVGHQHKLNETNEANVKDLKARMAKAYDHQLALVNTLNKLEKNKADMETEIKRLTALTKDGQLTAAKRREAKAKAEIDALESA